MRGLVETNRPLVALISGVTAAIPPASGALNDAIPAAQQWNLLDDRLIYDATRLGRVSEELAERMMRLVGHAAIEGANGVLLTCSMYGFLAQSATQRFGIPVHGPDDAAFAEVMNRAYGSIHLVSSVQLALEDSVERAADTFATAGVEVDVVPVLADGARAASLAGDTATVRNAIVNAVRATGRHAEAVLFANYSLADAAGGVGAALGVPVITGPALAAQALRDELFSSLSAFKRVGPSRLPLRTSGDS